ncbi:signal peptidase I [Streptantibioticus rubrisoli]|uniref:Signal peptidase I n=1 Tax=Streptantibioticus rubrisoli TaxID=1387313 RepID=A0ABT1PL60_9ACTN|nr:signal peptidase I [Streptantibioticus rubrisoli]MCQ4046099.1 signal peptidase I [Streptantibioticus rubrisoli]
MGNRGRPRNGHRAGAATAAADRPPGRAERRRAAQRVKRRRRRSAVREVPILIGVALLIALVLKTFLVQAFVIPSGSMEDTIRIGDRVLVDKLTPWFGSTPQRGDVVVFKDPGHWLDGEPKPKPDPEGVKQIKEFFTFIGLLPAANEQDLIKRVIAVGGDKVACCDVQGRVTVNGKALDEPYLKPGNPPSQIKFSLTVPAGRLWVMGDHRSDSADSRYHMDEPGGGTVAESQVVGRAFVIAWPFSHWRTLPEPGTFASVPNPGADAATALGKANNRQGMVQLPTPAELPLVMGVVGLRRARSRPWRGVRSGSGGPGGRRTVRTRRARRAGPTGRRRRGRGDGGESRQVP